MGFFPDDIQIETVSRYTRLAQGDNKLRFLGKPIFGWETWIDDGGSRQPKRFELDEKYEQSDLGPDGVKQFMAIKVYNYNDSCIQVFQITQKSIFKALKGYSLNPDYGNPAEYDITITRTGEGMKTSYTVIASPPKTANKDVVKADKDTDINLEGLFVNADPFI